MDPISACFEESAAICRDYQEFCNHLIDAAEKEATEAAQAKLPTQVLPKEDDAVQPKPTGSRPAEVARQIFCESTDQGPGKKKKHADNAGSSKLPAVSNEAPSAPDDSNFLKPAVPGKTKIPRKTTAKGQTKKASRIRPGNFCSGCILDASPLITPRLRLL